MPDLRGHGSSKAPDNGYEKAQLAADMHNLLDALEITAFATSATTGAPGRAFCWRRSPRSVFQRCSRFRFRTRGRPDTTVSPRDVLRQCSTRSLSVRRS